MINTTKTIYNLGTTFLINFNCLYVHHMFLAMVFIIVSTVDKFECRNYFIANKFIIKFLFIIIIIST